ncbi:Nucleotide pyrophosphatase/phosphodiesterase [Thalictrum thalictroides]|uniref:Nucleotide pyrophosphatase/phosphodiesterase n=1 Tax=Thalictrum thalictroides TaxID=46969 RepID=A0A7J6V1L7_THATH|nr:Nucleotide pyrophosphatase/phosphodiesterase [Thalictrum thalictroides]
MVRNSPPFPNVRIEDWVLFVDYTCTDEFKAKERSMKSDLMAGSAEENIDDHIGSSYQDQVQVLHQKRKRGYMGGPAGAGCILRNSNGGVLFAISYPIPHATSNLAEFFTLLVEPISSIVPYMVASGNHERDWPGTSSFYGWNMDSGGVPAQTIYYVPATNREKFWYATDYGMFHFCIADTEHD